MLALGVFIVIVTAGIDLSVGSIMMLSLMVLAITSKAGAPWYVVALVVKKQSLRNRSDSAT
jgi:ribose transport system permease protein